MSVTLTPPEVAASTRAMLIEELEHTEEIAEIINGKVVLMGLGTFQHGRASGTIYFSLKLHEKQHDGGYAFGDANVFLVDLPDRYSFCPDAAWRKVIHLHNNKFVDGAPDFAVEVRSAGHYSPSGGLKVLEKIKEYFAAGTQVVWDVDLLREGLIKKYTPETLDNPHVFKRGEIADAEPAVPGWRMAVDELF